MRKHFPFPFSDFAYVCIEKWDGEFNAKNEKKCCYSFRSKNWRTKNGCDMSERYSSECWKSWFERWLAQNKKFNAKNIFKHLLDKMTEFYDR